jgi:glutamine amidotransferase
MRLERESEIAAGIASETPFYFVHTLTVRPDYPADVLGTAVYGDRFVGAVERAPLFGFQFHPEKSSAAGLRLLENFAGVCTPVAA